MYGADGTQAAGLSATGGALLGVGWDILAIGVLLLATITAGTILKSIAHRMKGGTK